MNDDRYELFILESAQRELEEIAALHLRLVGPFSARKITNRIYDSLSLLTSNPHMGVDCENKSLELPGYRMLICQNYLCFYRVIDRIIYVYHIVDGRSDYPKLFAGLK